MTTQVYDGVLADNIDVLPERFERKYYLVAGEVGLAYGLLRHLCLSASEYPSEQINSLYFDTAGLEQHERSAAGDYNKDKVRIRWYGEDNDISGMRNVFIELKSRRGFTSTKQRLKLSVSAMSLNPGNLIRGIVPRTLLMDTLARFGCFPHEMLHPVIKISYWRRRFSEILTGQRVSLDCHIRSSMVMPGRGNGEKELELPGGVIEIKGLAMDLPPSLSRMRMLYLDWTRFSKYSSCIDSHLEEPGSMGRLSPSGRITQL
ncbi:MAG: VTC domain-containing protein [Dehalococcoidales bacterium]|nr:VTC domain-containing protein [Dehalococcoidales bacterium]